MYNTERSQRHDLPDASSELAGRSDASLEEELSTYVIGPWKDAMAAAHIRALAAELDRRHVPLHPEYDDLLRDLGLANTPTDSARLVEGENTPSTGQRNR